MLRGRAENRGEVEILLLSVSEMGVRSLEKPRSIDWSCFVTSISVTEFHSLYMAHDGEGKQCK